MAALKRLLIIMVAYAVTVLVAALGASLAIKLTVLSAGESLAIFAIFGFTTLIVGIFAAVPSALLVMIAEALRIRSPWYYMTIAVLTGVVLARLMTNEIWMVLVGAALGLVCGATFWKIAGRNAGVLKGKENGRTQIWLLLLLAMTIVAVAVLMFLFMR